MSKERGNDNEKDALFVPDIVEQRIQQVDIESEMKKSFLDVGHCQPRIAGCT